MVNGKTLAYFVLQYRPCSTVSIYNRLWFLFRWELFKSSISSDIINMSYISQMKSDIYEVYFVRILLVVVPATRAYAEQGLVRLECTSELIAPGAFLPMIFICPPDVLEYILYLIY